MQSLSSFDAYSEMFPIPRQRQQHQQNLAQPQAQVQFQQTPHTMNGNQPVQRRVSMTPNPHPNQLNFNSPSQMNIAAGRPSFSDGTRIRTPSGLTTPTLNHPTPLRNQQPQVLANHTTPTMSRNNSAHNLQSYMTNQPVNRQQTSSAFANYTPDASPQQSNSNMYLFPQQQSAPQLRHSTPMYSPSQLPMMPQTQPMMRRPSMRPSPNSIQAQQNAGFHSQMAQGEFAVQTPQSNMGRQAATGVMYQQDYNQMQRVQNAQPTHQRHISRTPSLEICREMAASQAGGHDVESIAQRIFEKFQQSQYNYGTMQKVTPASGAGMRIPRPRETVAMNGSPLSRMAPSQNTHLGGQNEPMRNASQAFQGVRYPASQVNPMRSAPPLQNSMLVNGQQHNVNGQHRLLNGQNYSGNSQNHNLNGLFHANPQLHNINGQYHNQNGRHYNVNLTDQSQVPVTNVENTSTPIPPPAIPNSTPSRQSSGGKRKRKSPDSDEPEGTPPKKSKKSIDGAEKPKKRARKPKVEKNISILSPPQITNDLITSTSAIPIVYTAAMDTAATAITTTTTIETPLAVQATADTEVISVATSPEEVAQPIDTSSIVNSIEEVECQTSLPQEVQYPTPLSPEEQACQNPTITMKSGNDNCAVTEPDELYLYNELQKASVNPLFTASVAIAENTEADNLTDYNFMMLATSHLISDPLRSPTPPDLGLNEPMFDFSASESPFKDPISNLISMDSNRDEPILNEPTLEKSIFDKPTIDFAAADKLFEDEGWTQDDISLFGDEVDFAGEGVA